MKKQGDIVGIATRNGVVDAVVVAVGWSSGGERYTLGLIPAPAKRTFFDKVKPLHLRPASGKVYTEAQIAAAISQAAETKDARAENDSKRTEARLDNLGEAAWEKGKGWTTEKLAVGDIAHFGTWSAKIVQINFKTGKVGIEREHQSYLKEKREEAAMLRWKLDELSSVLGGNYRRPEGPSLVRWVDPRAIQNVTKASAA